MSTETKHLECTDCANYEEFKNDVWFCHAGVHGLEDLVCHHRRNHELLCKIYDLVLDPDTQYSDIPLEPPIADNGELDSPAG